VPGFSVVYAPTVEGVRKCLLQIGWIRPADSYLDELPLVDEQLVVVPSSCDKHFSSYGCFEAASLFRGADEALVI